MKTRIYATPAVKGLGEVLNNHENENVSEWGSRLIHRANKCNKWMKAQWRTDPAGFQSYVLEAEN